MSLDLPLFFSGNEANYSEHGDWVADHSPGIRKGLPVVRAAEEEHANPTIWVTQGAEPSINEDGDRARGFLLLRCAVPLLLHLAVSGLLSMKRE